MARILGGPLRVGVVSGLGFDAEGLSTMTRARWGKNAVPVAFPAWGSLADHASIAGDGLIDAAVLPAEGSEDPAPVPIGLQSRLWLRTARPRRIGVALRHPRGEAALRDFFPNGSALCLIVMPPTMLAGNLAAGVVDAAVLLGTEPAAPAPGVTAVALDRHVAAALLPRLALRLRPTA